MPVGEEILDQRPCPSLPGVESSERLAACADPAAPTARSEGQGSIILVVASDAPLLPHQLKRIATRPSLGIARMGGRGNDGSGDIFVAFSAANPGAASSLNALLAAETMTGADGVRVTALPHDRLLAALRKYGRIR